MHGLVCYVRTRVCTRVLLLQMCVPWRAKTGSAVSKNHSREDWEGRECKYGVTLPPPFALCPADLVLSSLLLSLSSSAPLKLDVLQFPCFSEIFTQTNGLKL